MRSLVLQAVPLVLQASDLRVLLRTVAAQPSVGVLELFDAFPGRAAEDSHPRDDSRRQGFCPGLAEKPNVSACSDPLFNYAMKGDREKCLAVGMDDRRIPDFPEQCVGKDGLCGWGRLSRSSDRRGGWYWTLRLGLPMMVR